jgi:hypothetical protein
MMDGWIKKGGATPDRSNHKNKMCSHTRACAMKILACLSTNILKNWHACVYISHTNESFSHVSVSIRHVIYFCVQFHEREEKQGAPLRFMYDIHNIQNQ